MRVEEMLEYNNEICEIECQQSTLHDIIWNMVNPCETVCQKIALHGRVKGTTVIHSYVIKLRR